MTEKGTFKAVPPFICAGEEHFLGTIPVYALKPHRSTGVILAPAQEIAPPQRRYSCLPGKRIDKKAPQTHHATGKHQRG